MPKVSICQFTPNKSKSSNIVKASNYIKQAIINNSDIVVLPECFNCPYCIETFEEYAETIEYSDDSPTVKMLIDISKDYNDKYIFAGSIIEKSKDKLYNTCLVLYNGNIINKYRKMNLYTINLNKHSFSEGDVLSKGMEPTIVSTKFGKIGIGICYDIRFNMLAKYYMDNGCDMIIYPGSFNRITGPIHWKILQQVRALDNQLFIVSCSTAGDPTSSFYSYGKSFIISPFGETLTETELDKEHIISYDIDFNYNKEIRDSIPINK